MAAGDGVEWAVDTGGGETFLLTNEYVTVMSSNVWDDFATYCKTR